MRSSTESTAKQRGKAAIGKESSKSAKLEVSVEALTEDFEVNLKISTRKEEGEEEKSGGYGHSRNVEMPSGSSQRNEAMDSELRRGLETAKKHQDETPWNLRRFQTEPTGGNDVWDEALRKTSGWLVG